jgi:hypothetical protein
MFGQQRLAYEQPFFSLLYFTSKFDSVILKMLDFSIMMWELALLSKEYNLFKQVPPNVEYFR